MSAEKHNTDMTLYYKMKNRKGLSAVIATLMLVLLTLVLIGILWTVISNLVDTRLKNTESCFDIFEKVKINEQYTCFNVTGATEELQFSISLSDITINQLVISISGSGQQKSITLTNQDTLFPYLKPYNGAYNTNVKLPQANSGLTYVYNLTSQGFSGKPGKIEIAPIISGNQCDVSDTTSEIVYCTSLVS